MITNKKAIKKLALEIANEYDLGEEKTRVSKDFLEQVEKITYIVTRQLVRGNIGKAMTLTSTNWGDKLIKDGARVSDSEV